MRSARKEMVLVAGAIALAVVAVGAVLVNPAIAAAIPPILYGIAKVIKAIRGDSPSARRGRHTLKNRAPRERKRDRKAKVRPGRKKPDRVRPGQRRRERKKPRSKHTK